MQASTTRGTWSEAAQRVLRERYLWKKDGQIIEGPNGMCARVARAIAASEANWPHAGRSIEEVAEQFYRAMVERRFLPNSPTLMNAGKENGQQLSACFVLPVTDSLDGIFETLRQAALVHQSGGGTGMAFSRLRPKGAIVRSTQGTASGPVSFMQVFDAATEHVKQGGTRRGANMGILRIDHPDILEFIDCKRGGRVTNFNISVAVTEHFMAALARDEAYELVAPHTGEVAGTLRAREVFDRICRAAWQTGDPGLVFIDRANQWSCNPVPELGPLESTNPCGEAWLYGYDACNLGSINLARFVVSDGREKAVDWSGLEQTIRLGVRFLDDVIEVNPFPLPEINAMVRANRRIGLGIMGWADLLFELGIPYDSDDALALADRLMRFMTKIGRDESSQLAVERGPFPNFERSIYKDGPPIRNATVTTIAPTGTISIIADCSSGIEPLFALAFEHTVGERTLRFVNPVFERVARERGFYSEVLMQRVLGRGSVQDLPEVPADVRRVFVTAHEVSPEWHVRMQAASQRHTDNAVSKTINLPRSATVEDVAKAYLLADELGCLGITVYRDGCKTEQVLKVGVSQPVQSDERMRPSGFLPRPRLLAGTTYRTETPLGTAFVTVNRREESDEDEPFEVFLNVGKAGSDIAGLSEAIGRLCSLCLRLPGQLPARERVAAIVAQLAGIGGGRSLGFGATRVRSLPDAVARVLAEAIGLGDETWASASTSASVALAVDLCPSCGESTLIHREGCRSCPCGFSEC